MNHRIATGLTRVASHAARPARRGMIRALRHHSARTHALAEQLRNVHPVNGIRAWFRGVFFNLRVRTASRKVSLRALLRRPMQSRIPALPKPQAAAHTSRRPRRTSASSAGWYAFAAR